MGKHPWRSVALLIAGLGAMSLPARAALFEFQWAHKWGAGQISHHTGVADSDPSSLRDVFLGAIDAYQFYSYSIDENQAIAFSGVGGTLQVEHVRSRPGEDGCPDTGVAGCVTDTSPSCSACPTRRRCGWWPPRGPCPTAARGGVLPVGLWTPRGRPP